MPYDERQVGRALDEEKLAAELHKGCARELETQS
ncbi:hypothetical protein ABH908_003204 [Pseudomonas frederiksbergensis]